ncbi:MAG: hypothetical protein CMB77_03965 [Euryarchaeota archaeon]|nr:hypothetical protein [Euryarchaeota archaeon]|tara:strand:+ start:26459 stop:27643 length:1185 start_codon:yes stop_codon:yes gene_type:complete
MKYKKVRKIINNILFETTYNIRSTDDHRAGQFAAHQDDPENEESKVGLPKEVPLQPDDATGINAIMSRPPVEDDDYVPKTPSDLAAAVKAMSELMDNDEIVSVYAQFKDILKKGGDPENVNEGYDDYDEFELPDDSDMPDEFRSGYSIEDEPDEEPEESEKFQASKSSGEASLSDLVNTGLMPGVSGESGAKQWIGRKKKKMAAVHLIGDDQIQKAKNYARDIWVGALEATEALDSEEAAALKKSDYTLTNPAFLSFFNLGFLEPSLKPIRVQRDRDAKEEIASLDVPPQIETMVFNQLIGNSPISARKIRLKLNRGFPDMNLEEMDDVVSKAMDFIKSNTEKYQKEYLSDADFIKAVKDAWSKKSTKEKMDITFSAIDDAEDFQDQAGKIGLR